MKIIVKLGRDFRNKRGSDLNGDNVVFKLHTGVIFNVTYDAVKLTTGF